MRPIRSVKCFQHLTHRSRAAPASRGRAGHQAHVDSSSIRCANRQPEGRTHDERPVPATADRRTSEREARVRSMEAPIRSNHAGDTPPGGRSNTGQSVPMADVMMTGRKNLSWRPARRHHSPGDSRFCTGWQRRSVGTGHGFGCGSGSSRMRGCSSGRTTHPRAVHRFVLY
jgi:hypothetical protein